MSTCIHEEIMYSLMYKQPCIQAEIIAFHSGQNYSLAYTGPNYNLTYRQKLYQPTIPTGRNYSLAKAEITALLTGRNNSLAGRHKLQVRHCIWTEITA